MQQEPKTQEGGAAASRWPAAVRRLIRKITHRYHPERHYMRGGRAGEIAERNAAKARPTRH
jgi:hypothetical protein